MTTVTPELVELEPQETVAVRGEIAIADLPAFFGRAFHEAMAAARAGGVAIVGPAFGFYPRSPAGTVVIEAGFPVSGPVEAHDEAHRLVLPGGRALRVVHVGPFETLEKTYRELQSWAAGQGLALAAGMWETYLSDPENEPDPATWRTGIIWPLA